MRSLLWLALLALPQNTAPAPASTTETPLAREWIPSLGEVRVDTLGPLRLRVAIAGLKPRTWDLELDGFAPGARVLSARACVFLQDEIALALAVGNGTKASYHYLLRRPAEGESDAPSVRLQPGARENGWGLSVPLFESEGEPYRVVEAHNPGGDSLELTFRRGFSKNIYGPDPIALDEKVYLDVCAGVGPSMVGRLFEVTSAHKPR